VLDQPLHLCPRDCERMIRGSGQVRSGRVKARDELGWGAVGEGEFTRVLLPEEVAPQMPTVSTRLWPGAVAVQPSAAPGIVTSAWLCPGFTPDVACVVCVRARVVSSDE
jgi:hypothetical protein